MTKTVGHEQGKSNAGTERLRSAFLHEQYAACCTSNTQLKDIASNIVTTCNSKTALIVNILPGLREHHR